MVFPCMFGVLRKLSIIFTATVPTLVISHMCIVKGHFSEKRLCSCTSSNTLVLLLWSSFYGGGKLVFGVTSFLLPCGQPHSIFKG